MSISDRHRDAVDAATRATRSTTSNREASIAVHAAVVALVEEVQDDLLRCRRWLDRGLVGESVAYAEDRHELLRRAVELQALCEGPEWRSWCEREDLPDAPAIDGPTLSRLNTAFAKSGSLLGPLRTMRRAFLANEDAVRRIETVRKLADLDSSNRMWSDHAATLEADAIAEIAERADRAMASDDLSEIEACLERLAAPWRAPTPTGLAKRLSRRRDLLRKAHSDRTFVGLADRAHEAMAAMDVETLERLESEWSAAIEQGLEPPEHALSAIAAPFDHLASVRRAASANEARRRALDDLERALDEGRRLEEIERCAAAALEFDDLPAGLAGRIAAVREREASRRNRGIAVAAVAAAALGIALVLAGGRLWSVLDRRSAAQSSTSELRRLIDEERSLDAAALARELLDDRASLVEDSPELAAAIELAIGAEREELARRARIDAALAASERELADDDLSAAEISAAMETLRRSTAEAGDRERTRVEALEAEWSAKRRRRLDADVVEARRRHADFVETIGSIPDPDRGDSPEARRSALAALAALESDLADASRTFEHLEAERDRFREISQRVERRLERWRTIVEERERYEAALAALEDPNLDEVAFHEAYRRLLSEHGAMLQADGVLESHERGERSARAALAIAHWREIVWPAAAVLGEPGDDGSPRSLEAAGRLADQLEDHLDRHPGSPYEQVATTLRDRCMHLSALATEADTAAEWIRGRFEASGLTDLWVLPLREGVMYGRGFRDGRIQGAVPSMVELEQSLESLAAPLIPDADVVGVPKPAASVDPIVATLDRIDAVMPSQAESELLMLFADVANRRFEDPGLQLHLLRLVADVIADLDATSEAGVAMRRWLERVRTDHPRAVRQDWLVAAQGGSARNRRDAARAAAAAMEAPPDAERLAAASAARAEAIRDALAVLAPSGVLSAPSSSGRRSLSGRAATLPTFSVVVFDPGSDRCRLESGRRTDDAVILPIPSPPPVPVQVFTR